MDRRQFLAGALPALYSAGVAARAGRAAEGAAEVTSLLPFAGADNVRVEATLTGSDADGLELHGRIETWPLTPAPPFWNGLLGTAHGAGSVLTVTHTITGLKPLLWDMESPHLYRLTVTAKRGATTVATRAVRFGFRSFVTHDGQFFLNGRPIFLRGNSINAPGRGLVPSVATDRVFAEAYVRDLKSRNINLLRTGGAGSEVWLDVCDELGMLIFQGRYGAPPGGRATAPPADFDASIAAYKSEYFNTHLRHPSVVINILSNEMPPRGPVGEAYARYLDRAYQALRVWDPNRLYIDNAGFGHGRSGDLNDQHPYDGWYGSTFLAYYRYRTPPAKVQPITLSETVGAYTQPDGRFQIASKQLAAALTWTGHTTTPERDGYAYQAFLAGQIVESFRRMRAINPRLAGVMPFTDIFDHWQGVSRFEQMHAKPVADQLRVSYQPVLLSWELWTAQVYAGSAIRPLAHIVNDADDGSDLTDGATLTVSLTAAGKDAAILTSSLPLPPVPYYAAKTLPVPLTLPANLPTGDCTLHGRIEHGGKVISENRADLYIAAAPLSHRSEFSGPIPIYDREGNIDDPAILRAVGNSAKIALYDPAGKTVKALVHLEIGASPVNDLSHLPPTMALIIGEDALSAVDAAHQEALKTFVAAGGRVLLLRQPAEALTKSAGWLGIGLRFSDTSTGMWINPERSDHPVFEGIPRERLRVWSDPTGWDQTRPGTPAIAPVGLAFTVAKPVDMARAAVLADFGRGLVNMALGEIFTGKGSVVISGFDLVSRAGLDPIAGRMLRNLISYTAGAEGHYAAPLIEHPIMWGDYATERGVVGGPQYGLIVNVGDASGGETDDHSVTVGLSDTVLVPQGRRPFGPFSYNGNCHIIDDNPGSPTGSGIFFARLPAGRRQVTTRVRNPGRSAGSLIVEVNGTASAPVTVEAGKTVTFSTPLGGEGVTEVAVRFTGTKTLVLLETAFT